MTPRNLENFILGDFVKFRDFEDFDFGLKLKYSKSKNIFKLRSLRILKNKVGPKKVLFFKNANFGSRFEP